MSHGIESHKRWELITAEDLMRPNVIVIDYSSPLTEAAQILSEANVSGAPVVDEAGHIVGILSLKDLVGAFAAERAEGQARSPEMPRFKDRPKSGEDIVGDVMNAEIYSVPVTASVTDIARLMTKHQIHRVLVERDGKHVGLISTMEITSALCA